MASPNGQLAAHRPHCMQPSGDLSVAGLAESVPATPRRRGLAVVIIAVLRSVASGSRLTNRRSWARSTVRARPISNECAIRVRRTRCDSTHIARNRMDVTACGRVTAKPAQSPAPLRISVSGLRIIRHAISPSTEPVFHELVAKGGELHSQRGGGGRLVSARRSRRAPSSSSRSVLSMVSWNGPVGRGRFCAASRSSAASSSRGDRAGADQVERAGARGTTRGRCPASRAAGGPRRPPVPAGPGTPWRSASGGARPASGMSSRRSRSGGMFTRSTSRR